LANTRKITLADAYVNSERNRRISLDFDVNKSYRKIQLLSAYIELQHMFPKCEVSVQRTRHGFHIKVVGDEISKIKVADRIKIREFLGDDWMRVELDKRKMRQGRYYAVDVLFEIKQGYDGKISQPFDINPFALPYWSKLPSAKVF
jgi:hypothetical protein